MASLTAYAGFSKRKNSTKQPTGAGTAITCTLKDDTSMVQPTFILAGNNFTYNYVAFAGRYYYVDDVVSLHNGLCEVQCNIDVLATYKSAIQATTAYVLYYNHNQTEISDKRLTTKTTKTVDLNTGAFDTLGNGTGTNYAVVLNTIGYDACDSFVTDQATARGILSNLDNWFGDPGSTGSGIKPLSDGIFDWSNTAEAIKSFCQETLFFWRQWFATGKASDNLRSAYVLPLPVSAIGGYTENIILGQYDTGVSATRVNDRIFRSFLRQYFYY